MTTQFAHAEAGCAAPDPTDGNTCTYVSAGGTVDWVCQAAAFTTCTVLVGAPPAISGGCAAPAIFCTGSFNGVVTGTTIRLTVGPGTTGSVRDRP